MEYGCIGEKLSHSFSKEIHNLIADYDYRLVELKKEELHDFFEKKEFKAINVTIPYKLDVMPFLDSISPEAKEINAVNTIVNKDGKLYGYNTDFYGLKSLIERYVKSFSDKTVVILGSGGTSNTAFSVAKSLDAKEIIKVSRKKQDGYITYEELYDKYSDCEIIINTTPCGMFPKVNASAVDINKFNNLEAVFDAVYNPLKSKFILDAQKQGVTATGGLYMLVSQAASAVEKFIDTEISQSKIDEVYKKICKDKLNIVLIGMPGCGKSSVGKELEKSFSKSFVDSDNVIVEKAEKNIPDIFKDFGETYFRSLEKDVIQSISLSNSQIIATGGGVVLNSQNIDNLKSNGRIYFIDRPLYMLAATDDRPLSRNKEALEKRYNERYKLYREYADVIVDGKGSVNEVAERIEADFNEYSCY